MARYVVWPPVLLLAFLFVCSHIATAQSPTEWRDASGKESTKELTLNQKYQGTTPGKGNTLPKVEEIKAKTDGNWITWPGFVMNKNGTSRLFIQTTSPISYKKTKKANRVSLSFTKTKIFLSNNRNPLVTVHFNTPMKRAYLRYKKKAAELIIELKTSVTFNIHQVSYDDGYHYLFVDFPSGDYPTKEDTKSSIEAEN